MNFIEAVKLLKEEEENDIHIRVFIHRKGRYIKRSGGFIAATYTIDNPYENLQYDPPILDILADDWEVYYPDICNFQEAIKALKEGKVIRRKSRGSAFITNIDHLFSLEDIKAEDWIIKNEITSKTADSKKLYDLDEAIETLKNWKEL